MSPTGGTYPLTWPLFDESSNIRTSINSPPRGRLSGAGRPVAQPVRMDSGSQEARGRSEVAIGCSSGETCSVSDSDMQTPLGVAAAVARAMNAHDLETF